MGKHDFPHGRVTQIARLAEVSEPTVRRWLCGHAPSMRPQTVTRIERAVAALKDAGVYVCGELRR